MLTPSAGVAFVQSPGWPACNEPQAHGYLNPVDRDNDNDKTRSPGRSVGAIQSQVDVSSKKLQAPPTVNGTRRERA